MRFKSFLSVHFSAVESWLTRTWKLASIKIVFKWFLDRNRNSCRQNAQDEGARKKKGQSERKKKRERRDKTDLPLGSARQGAPTTDKRDCGQMSLWPLVPMLISNKCLKTWMRRVPFSAQLGGDVRILQQEWLFSLGSVCGVGGKERG